MQVRGLTRLNKTFEKVKSFINDIESLGAINIEISFYLFKHSVSVALATQELFSLLDLTTHPVAIFFNQGNTPCLKHLEKLTKHGGIKTSGENTKHGGVSLVKNMASGWVVKAKRLNTS